VEQGAAGYVGGGGAVLCFALYVVAHPAEVVHVYAGGGGKVEDVFRAHAYMVEYAAGRVGVVGVLALPYCCTGPELVNKGDVVAFGVLEAPVGLFKVGVHAGYRAEDVAGGFVLQVGLFGLFEIGP